MSNSRDKHFRVFLICVSYIDSMSIDEMKMYTTMKEFYHFGDFTRTANRPVYPSIVFG